MNDYFDLQIAPTGTDRRGRHERTRRGAAWAPDRQAGSFRCAHCHNEVITLPHISGVQNRNHCPYCLWSKHLDHRQAGDRLSACKAPMQPAGVALKLAHKKYGDPHGELMLAHVCSECGKVSLNRIAADDDPHAILAVYEASCRAQLSLPEEVSLLGKADARLVRRRLFGRD